MTADPFDAYKMPPGLTDGVEIPLPNTDVVFTVRLPANLNEDFTLTLLSRVNTRTTESGAREVDTVEFTTARKALFFETCILSHTGTLPHKMDPQEFFEFYGLAAAHVWREAQRLAQEADNAASDAVGKSKRLPNGSPSGGENMTSMKPSKKRASKSKQPVPN